jgi:membrane-associated phospholipid phosphatase
MNSFSIDKSLFNYLPQKKVLRILINLILCGLLPVTNNGIVFSANSQVLDSANVQYKYLEKPNQNDSLYHKSTNNFYKTDSIFSFRSSKGYFPSLLKDFEEQITAPFKQSAKQWIMTGAAIGITAALIHVDGEIDEWARAQKTEHKWVNKSSPVITNFGGSWGVYSVIAAGALSAACKNEKGLQTSLLATQAMITSGVWVNIIKIFTGRERPIADYTFSKTEGGAWYGPFSKWDQDLKVRKPVSEFDAFPSGHTATAFSIATVFASQYKNIKAIPVICYSAATLVGISRLTEHEHWASDVFVGGIMGYLCGKQVVNHYNKTHQDPANPLSSKSKNKTELILIEYSNRVGILLKW